MDRHPQATDAILTATSEAGEAMPRPEDPCSVDRGPLPRRLLVVATGNIRNAALPDLFDRHLDTMVTNVANALLI